MKHLKIVLSVLLSLCCPVRSHAQQESVESFVQVTFDNSDGVTVAQTDELPYIPDPDTILLMLNHQPTNDEFSANSAEAVLVTRDSSGVILSSQLLYFVIRS